MNVAPKTNELGMETAPLRLDKRGIGAAGPAHPGVDFVFDPVVIRRTKQKIAHTNSCLTIGGDKIGQLAQEGLDVGHETDRLKAAAIG